MDLAARKTASPELVRRTLEYLDQNIARELAAESENQQWKLLKLELLVALDRPHDLQGALEDWIKAGDADNRWRLALGYLLAEEGKLAEAIPRFESVAAADELGPSEWRTLADWYQAVNRREDYDRAKVEVYKTADEGQLAQLVYSQVPQWVYNQGQLPSQLDPEVVLAFRALLSKSANPQNYINYPLRDLYKASRDFRLLSCLADSISGHTAGQIHPYLQSAKGVVDEIREEAAVDELTERIASLQGKAKTDVDRRAYDLLEAMTERRAAELRNQPSPHVDKAVAALRRALKRQWSPGEERLMADFLAALGRIPQEKLAAEQLRQLEAFYNDAKLDTQQRLDMACIYARALWSYDRRQAVLDLLQSEVDRYATVGNGKPLCEQQIFLDFISYLDQAGQFTEAVKRLENERQQAQGQDRRKKLEARIIEVHIDALGRPGQIGDLKGAELYRAVQARILAQLPSGDSPYDARLITLLSSLYGTAKGQNVAGAAADLKTFAFQTLPPLLKRQVAQYEGLENNLAEQLHCVCGPADSIAFFVERYGQRPPWLKLKQNFWNAHGWQLTTWRHDAGNLDAPLSDRLLKVVLVFLRDRLEGRGVNSTGIWDRGNHYYWADREGDFLRCAEEIYAQNKHNGGIFCNVADYLWGLGHMDRAIEILQVAEQEHLLDEGGQAKLVNYLHAAGRFGESIRLLQALVEAHPDNLEYRRLLMYAYFRTNRKDELLGLLKQTDDYFHQKDRWGEGPLAMLAGSCLQNELFEQSVMYYKELIPLHERTAPNRGIGDGTLSGYYGGQAQALAGLKRMPEAVEAACGAIISWGNNVGNRAHALEALRNILRSCESGKLDALVAELDAQTAKTGNDNAFVRKALGQVYSERAQDDKALVQLRLALDLQRNDVEIYDALVACCDKQNDKQGAIRELFAKMQFARRDLNIYKDLGRRFAELKDDHQAERAYTSIVEVLVFESESHTMLAEVREGQNRWAEAIDQWRQVAKLRAPEPNGLLRLAAAQVHEKQWAAAEETVHQLRAKTWPPRFGNTEFQIQQLQQQIIQGKQAR
jgi:predicted Zn-dependent protease